MKNGKQKRISAILLAGGGGTRFHGKKQFVQIGGYQMWEYPYRKICSLIGAENVTVVGVDIPGGSTRTESVLCGMKAVDGNTERVIIIEAARPMVTCEQMRLLIEDESPSVTFVRPLVNTVIYRNGNYINRDELFEILTPQAFDYRLLYEALMSGDFTDMTDETRIMQEFYRISPKFIETAGNLMKVTYPEDLYTVQYLINKRGGSIW